jgi:hypothetical protein
MNVRISLEFQEAVERRISWKERICQGIQRFNTAILELRYDMIQAKKAARRTGWWSDGQDWLESEEFAVRRALARSRGWPRR